MEIYSQKDYRWKNSPLGWCRDTIERSGCFVTCLAMFVGKNPSQVNQQLKAEGGYTNGCMIVSRTAAKTLGLDYTKRVYKEGEAEYPCIAETDYWKKSGVPQHFFILLNKDTKIDPLELNPQPKNNNYHIVSWRLFKPKTMKENPILQKTMKLLDILGVDAGKKPNENELDKAIKYANGIKKLNEDLEEAHDRLDGDLTKLKAGFSIERSKYIKHRDEQAKAIDELTDKLAKCKQSSDVEKMTIGQLFEALIKKIIK